MSLEHDIANIIESVDLALYDTIITSENGETIFRVNITTNDNTPVSMQQCVEVTKLISPLLDVEEPVSGKYRLEVSSPGIERKLKTLDHFQKSVGDKVKITTADKTKYNGEILAVDGKDILIKTKEGEEVTLNFDTIIKASTYFEW